MRGAGHDHLLPLLRPGRPLWEALAAYGIYVPLLAAQLSATVTVDADHVVLHPAGGPALEFERLHYVGQDTLEVTVLGPPTLPVTRVIHGLREEWTARRAASDLHALAVHPAGVMPSHPGAGHPADGSGPTL